MSEYDVLILAAKRARENAYAKFSNFKVGAGLRATSGKIYGGCNVENATYGLTICAERVAIFKAISEGERGFDAIAVVTDTDANGVVTKPGPDGDGLGADGEPVAQAHYRATNMTYFEDASRLMTHPFLKLHPAEAFADVLLHADMSPIIIRGLIDGYIDIAFVYSNPSLENETEVTIAAEAGKGLGPAAASATNVFGTEFATEAYRLLMEVLGSHASVREGSPGAVLAGRIERAHRAALILTFGGGTNEVQRDIVAATGLGLPAAKR